MTQSSSVLKGFAALSYRDPAVVLRELRQIEAQMVGANLSPQVRNLRTNGLKHIREFRHAALFCHGMSLRLGYQVLFSPVESSDYDFVATWRTADAQHFARVQLKELVPAHLNEGATVQALVDGLSKYSGDDLIVAIFLNREGRFSLEEVVFPPCTLQSCGSCSQQPQTNICGSWSGMHCGSLKLAPSGIRLEGPWFSQ